MEGTMTIGEWIEAHPEALVPSPARSESDGPRIWVALATEPQREATAAAHLMGRRIGCYLPAIAVYAKRGRAMQWRTEPMFRSYLFVSLSVERAGEEAAEARRLPGTLDLVRVPGRNAYAVIKDSDIAAMRQAEAISYERKRRNTPYEGKLKPGDQVRIGEGPFEGWVGTISQLHDAERIVVLMEMLGRATPITFSLRLLEAG